VSFEPSSGSLSQSIMHLLDCILSLQANPRKSECLVGYSIRWQCPVISHGSSIVAFECVRTAE